METVADLMAELSKLPPQMKIRGEKFVNRWSGNPEDTDLSGYEQSPIWRIDIRKEFKAFEKDDPRWQDKRRTKFAEYIGEVAVIQIAL